MNIYVGNLSLDVTGKELQQEFMAFGQVQSVIVMNDKYIGSGQSRGYAFVLMPSHSEATTAIMALNGKTLKGMTINIIEALPLTKNSGIGRVIARSGNRSTNTIRERKY
jgi:RNA recognition motif-containing protein